jgi:iduronate 2-sulfatase
MSHWQKNEILANSSTISGHFKRNGYYTLGTGKVMHNHVPDQWDEFKSESDYGPFAFNGEEDVPHPMTPSPLRDDFGKIDGSFGPFIKLEGRDFGDGKQYRWRSGNWKNTYDIEFTSEADRGFTADESNAQWAIQRLGELASEKREQPFFMAVGFMRPHTPLIVPQPFFDRYPIESLDLPVILENDADDTFLLQSRGGNDRGRKIYKSLVASYGGDRELALKHFVQAYLACVASVDEHIGGILETLEKTRLIDNTVIVFTSDHGWGNGPKDIVYKNTLWEESTRVPLIIRAPGVSKQDVMVEQPVSLVDLFPTLIELCGLPKETRLSTQGVPLDGYSLVPFLKNADNAKWSGPAAALTAIHKWNDPDPAKQSYSLRSKDWRYIRYHNGDEELYHNAADRYEWTNLSAKPEYASVVTAFRQEMDQRVYQTFAAQADPSTALKVEASAAVSKDAGEDWKDKYFKNHPDADANRDGTLTWPEYKKHKSALDSRS